MRYLEEIPIKSESPDGWLQVVLADFDTFLLDHASCERKAAALAMSFVAKYPDRTVIVDPMVSLAREELEHFSQVYKILNKRRLILGSDEKDPYVNAFIGKLRHGRDERFLDRLLASALIEARGCERFHKIGENIEDPELRHFYSRLAASEAGHFKIFVRIAEHYFGKETTLKRLNELMKVEEEVMLAVPFRAALH